MRKWRHVHRCRCCEELRSIGRLTNLNCRHKQYLQSHNVVQWGLPAIGCEEAWEIGTGHPDVRIAIVDSNLNRASFSNYGPNYNRFVMAPGVEIGSTYKDNGYVYLDGTSMATPFVTGLARLIVSLALRSNVQLSVDDVFDIIRDTATDLGNSYFYGEGLVNTRAALEAARNKLVHCQI